MKIKKIKFKDYQNFNPNLTPKQIFELGSFGGTYFRPIYSSITKKNYKNIHHKYSFLKSIPDKKLIMSYNNYNKLINKYKVKVGTTLEFWEEKKWIKATHPYGWVQWYCDFYKGERSKDDVRQINRWKKITGPNGRFLKWLITLILKKKGKWNDVSISPKIRQTLQHWGFQLTKQDFITEIKKRKH